jgi:hypothetical protein
MAVAGVVAGQDPPTRVGRLNYVMGSVSYQPGGVNEWVPATINRPLTIGDQLYADAGARAEIHVPGAAFRLGSKTAFEFMNLDDRNTQVRLSEGSLDLRVRTLFDNFEVDTPNLAFTITSPGAYRIDTDPDTYETYVTVRDGEGQVTGDAGAFRVHLEEQAIVTGQDGARFNVYQAPQYDDFDNWARSRDQREDRARSAARYVSPDMVGYEDLDQYGYWRSVPEYGRCWVPRNVPVGWAPYHDGHWAWIDPWGWTWVDDEPWGFAPFHYGRWAYFDGAWGWVPGPPAVAPVYAPALVAWVGLGGSGFGASFGFGVGPAVGWFPLGPRDVYIPAYAASQTYVSRVNVTNTTVINKTNITNVYNNYVQTKTISTANYMNRSVPGAVAAVPQNALATAQPVKQVAIKVQPSQINTVKTVEAAPRVAPQAVSVLGHAPPVFASVPRPAAAAITKPVVARSTPPLAPAPFQQRQTLLAQNPGHPIPIQKQQQIARAAPTAVRQPVKVLAQARSVFPPVSNEPASRSAPGVPAIPQHPLAAGQIQNASSRPALTEPPPQQPTTAPGTLTKAPPSRAQRPSRPFEAPPAQSHPSPPSQARPNSRPSVQQRLPVEPGRPLAPQAPMSQAPRANRPYEPPTVPEHRVPAAPANRPSAAAPPQEQRIKPQPPEPGRNRSAPPPKPQYQPPQAPPVPPPRPAALPGQEHKTTAPSHQNEPKKEDQKKEERR